MRTVMFWSCAGTNAAEVSYGTADMLAKAERTLIAELPCLGIPRLGFLCGVMDNKRNTEGAITGYEQKKTIDWEMVQSLDKYLCVLAANVFAAPDYPIAMKVTLDALTEFVPALQQLAMAKDMEWLILECQGQMHSPMTFFSLRAADKIVIPLGRPTEAAYALASVKRLIQAYQFQADAFVLAVEGNRKAIEGAALSDPEDEGLLRGLQVTTWDCRRIRALLSAGEAPSAEKGKEGKARFGQGSIKRQAEGLSGELSVSL
ncbi:MAG: hypothetical protein FWF83_05945 [Clostridiales bacterium]|nr:hypothetical protein [Clostridiales bacterium]